MGRGRNLQSKGSWVWRDTKSTNLKVTQGPRPCSIAHSTQSLCLRFPFPVNGKLPGKRAGLSTLDRALSLSLHCSRKRSQGVPLPHAAQPKQPQETEAKDTSMRFTMLRHDSRLKPLVRKSLSARKPVPTPQPRELLRHRAGVPRWDGDRGSMIPGAWHGKV